MNYDVAVWMAKAGQLEYERNLLIKLLDLRDAVKITEDAEEMIEYRQVWTEVQELRKRLKTERSMID